MIFKMNILASDEAQYLDADDVKTERTCLSKDGKFSVLWKIGTKYYAEINTYYDGNFWLHLLTPPLFFYFFKFNSFLLNSNADLMTSCIS